MMCLSNIAQHFNLEDGRFRFWWHWAWYGRSICRILRADCSFAWKSCFIQVGGSRTALARRTTTRRSSEFSEKCLFPSLTEVQNARTGAASANSGKKAVHRACLICLQLLQAHWSGGALFAQPESSLLFCERNKSLVSLVLCEAFVYIVLVKRASMTLQAGGGGGILKFYSDDTPGLKARNLFHIFCRRLGHCF